MLESYVFFSFDFLSLLQLFIFFLLMSLCKKQNNFIWDEKQSTMRLKKNLQCSQLLNVRNNNISGLVLWCRWLSCCWLCWHPIWVPVQILAALLFIYLPTEELEKIAEDGLSAWALSGRRLVRSSRLLVWAWYSPGCCVHLGCDSADGRALFCHPFLTVCNSAFK